MATLPALVMVRRSMLLVMRTRSAASVVPRRSVAGFTRELPNSDQNWLGTPGAEPLTAAPPVPVLPLT